MPPVGFTGYRKLFEVISCVYVSSGVFSLFFSSAGLSIQSSTQKNGSNFGPSRTWLNDRILRRHLADSAAFSTWNLDSRSTLAAVFIVQVIFAI